MNSDIFFKLQFCYFLFFAFLSGLDFKIRLLAMRLDHLNVENVFVL